MTLTQCVSAVRFAFRALRRSPGYAIPVIVSLALGLGLNGAIFTVIEQVVLRPLPYPDESSLVTIGTRTHRSTGSTVNWNATRWGDLVAWQQGSRVAAALAVIAPYQRIVEASSGPESVTGAMASTELPAVVRIAPLLGRWFDASERRMHVVVISFGFWQRHFAGSPDAISRTIRIQGEPWTVVGVMPPHFDLPFGASFWVPAVNTSGQLIARTVSGAKPEDLARELSRLSPSVANARAAGDSIALVGLPLREQLFGSARPALRLLSLAGVLLFLITCANVANLSLARTTDRIRELAVRVAVGASRSSLAVLVVAENLVLSLLGAIGGCALAYSVTRLIVALAPLEFWHSVDIGVTVKSIAYVSSLTCLAAVLVSLGSVVLVSRRRSLSLVSSGSPSGGRDPSIARLRQALVAAQLAFALILLTGAGLLVRSLASLSRIDHLGFSPDGVVIASVRLFGIQYRDPASRQAFVRDLTARWSRVPGVVSVAVGPPPLVGGRGDALREGFDALFLYSDTTAGAGTPTTVWLKHVDHQYLSTFRIALRQGRGFQPADTEGAAPVAVLNVSAARLLFPGRDPIGMSLPVGGSPDKAPPRVVGIVDDVLQRDPTMPPQPEVLMPVAQQAATSALATFAVRGTVTSALITGLRQGIREIDPALAASRLEPMSVVVGASLQRHTFLLALLSLFAGLGLAVAAIGLYAVVSYVIARRTAEIGVRLALGAQRHDVVRMLLAETAGIIAAGLTLGIIAALWLSRWMAAYLREMQAFDTGTFLVTPLVLALVAVAAAYFPARKAAMLDPSSALRVN